MSKETERCLWMAEKLYPNVMLFTSEDCPENPDRLEGCCGVGSKLNIFSLEDEATQLKSVIWLGEKHGITLTFQDTGDGGCWGIFKYGVGDIGYEILDGTESHQAALMSAIDFLMEKDNG